MVSLGIVVASISNFDLFITQWMVLSPKQTNVLAANKSNKVEATPSFTKCSEKAGGNFYNQIWF